MIQVQLVKSIGLSLIVIAIVVAAFGVWLKDYNDKLTELQVNETGSCYLSDGTCLHTTSNNILYSTSALALVLAFLGIYLFSRKTLSGASASAQAPTSTPVIQQPAQSIQPVQQIKSLAPEHRQVFDLLAQSNGAMLQGEIVQKSGLDKVKVSRILDKLEMQGLIERRRHGMSNMVVLKKFT